jgi:hypothetical protein
MIYGPLGILLCLLDSIQPKEEREFSPGDMVRVPAQTTYENEYALDAWMYSDGIAHG